MLDVHCLTYGAIISSIGAIESRVGDASELDDAGLVSALLGPQGSAKETYASVQDECVLLPRIWSQGKDVAFVDRAGKWCVVVFGRCEGDAAAQYALSRRVHRTIQSEFTT